jgi:hypothetical protein
MREQHIAYLKKVKKGQEAYLTSRRQCCHKKQQSNFEKRFYNDEINDI